MKYILRNPINSKYTTQEQILTNRGIAKESIPHFLNPSMEKDIASPTEFGEELLNLAVITLIKMIKKNKRGLIIIDCDCDGQTSAALLANYLYSIFPHWTSNNIDFFLHDGKQHGLTDCIDEALKYDFVICPDSASGDLAEHAKLKGSNIPVIVLDHHDTDINPIVYTDAIIINNQASDYENKELSGVGVTWQFCRYLDNLLGRNNANNFLDLVSVGLIGDMMSMCSIETNTLIHEGLKNINNPFIEAMADKNSYSLGADITPIGVAFYIVPYINAMCRSGTQEEKKLMFESMLVYKAFERVPSTKRGHAKDEMETKVSQAVRVANSVKLRQTKIQNAAMGALKKIIEDRDLMSHKALIITLEDGELDIPAEVRGLCANKIMAEYSKPCAILAAGQDEYAGSARGCNKTGVRDFKAICEQTGFIVNTAGHPGAFGLTIKKDRLDNFISAIDEQLSDINDEAQYLVDYIFNNENFNTDIIKDIVSLSNYWGQDVEEPLVAIDRLLVIPEAVSVYAKTNLTIKIALPNGAAIMYFNAPEELCSKLKTTPTTINVVGTCNLNHYMQKTTPQIFVKELEEVTTYTATDF